jgi:hypothetical protein
VLLQISVPYRPHVLRKQSASELKIAAWPPCLQSTEQKEIDVTFTRAEIRELSAGNDAFGWSAIPEGCPPKFFQIILETRARRIGFRGEEFPAPVISAEPDAPQADVEALRARLQELSI